MTSKNNTWKNTSEYYDKLEPNGKLSYVKKLTLNNGFLLPDPCCIKDTEWSSDETLLLDIGKQTKVLIQVSKTMKIQYQN